MSPRIHPRFSKKYQSGISLIEVLISTAILGILIISTLELFTFFKDEASALETLQVKNIDDKSVEKLRDRVNSNTKQQLNKGTFCSNQNLIFDEMNNCSYSQSQVLISNNFAPQTDRLDLINQDIEGLGNVVLNATYNSGNGTLTITSDSSLTANQWQSVLEHVRFSEANLAPPRLIELTFGLTENHNRCAIDAITRSLDLTIIRKYCSN